MPPSQNTPKPILPPNQDPSHMLPPKSREQSSVGPFVGALIVIVLLAFGGLYFWGEHLNKQKTGSENQLPFIPADDSASAV